MEDWEKGIDPTSVDRAVKAGDILPELPVQNIGDTVLVKILSLPRQLTGKDGKEFWVMDVENMDGAKFFMYVSNSLKFSLKVEKQKHGLESILDHTFVIGRQSADFSKKGGKKDSSSLYCQLKE